MAAPVAADVDMAVSSTLVHFGMLPYADSAVVEPSKVRDYLLSASHPIGRFKATVFFALGYTPENWQRLRDDLLALARTGNVTPSRPSPYGQTYEVSGILTGPSGRKGRFVSVWLLPPDKEQPVFVT